MPAPSASDLSCEDEVAGRSRVDPYSASGRARGRLCRYLIAKETTCVH
jgi:hypothetical protein